jgi:hypothetical protein
MLGDRRRRGAVIWTVVDDPAVSCRIGAVEIKVGGGGRAGGPAAASRTSGGGGGTARGVPARGEDGPGRMVRLTCVSHASSTK